MVGVGLLTLAAGLVAQHTLGRHRSCAAMVDRAQLSAPIASLSALCVASLVDFPLRVGGIALLAAMLLGRLLESGAPEGRHARGAVSLLAAVVGCVALVGGLTARGEGTLWGSHSFAARQAWAAEDSQTAARWLALASSRAPLDGASLSRLGRLLPAPERLPALQLATRLDPAHPQPWIRLARELADRGQWQDSRAAWKRALWCDIPEAFELDGLVAEALQGPGEPLAIALELAGDRGDRAASLGKAFDGPEYSLEAEVLYLRAVELDPEQGRVLADAYLNWGLYEDAIARSAPFAGRCAGERVTAMALFGLEHYAEAVEHYEVAIELCRTKERLQRELRLARERSQ